MAQASFWDEIRKIPPVTRFLCGSTLAVSLPVMLQIVSPYTVIFVKPLVMKRLQVWRVFTSFFLGSSGINFIFDLAMLYRNSDALESTHFPGRSADYAWQLLLTACGILALNIPLGSFVHTRPLLLALTYLGSALAPPGAQTSFFGLITFPIQYLPYALAALDLIMGGPAAAAQSVTGLVAGHAWWYLIFGGGAGPSTRSLGSAPGWLKKLLGQRDGVATRLAGTTGGGVHVIPPRTRQPVQETGGHRWGAGHRLGE
ncbi:DER1-domain-containing protein [Gloeophyllum trabeum ATCC 11539]|uniref:Derlin n=1 Tax=Gloeophyllum trabeum (strain ATCC 11539 / FP-39264 / Madison 617) TaxID=670483 RepID=S7Q2A7_GLOTA|nr:DER1-domain-containing protein [Gloeophyllum trabeum ATCC 11539]EPQ53682.1 DER1-domain-containing protein [Gloeophyllum trabeum ATCC 11539]